MPPSQVHSQHEMRGCREEVGRGAGLVGEEDKEEEEQDAGKAVAKCSSGTRTEKADRAIPSTQNGALPHRAIPRMEEEHEYGGMRAVSVQDTDTKPPV